MDTVTLLPASAPNSPPKSKLVDSKPYPTAPAPKVAASGNSATRMLPTETANTAKASVIRRRTGSFHRNTNPARMPRWIPSSTSVRRPVKDPLTVATRAAETANDAALRANTMAAPPAATSKPPMAGPAT